MRQKLPLVLLSLVGILVLAGCLPGLIGGPTSAPLPTMDPNDLATAVVQTVAIRQTIAFLETQVAITIVPTEASGVVSSATPRPPTATLYPTSTLPPTWTPVPTLANTPTPSIPCNRATFVEDVTYPDGTVVAPGQSLTKTWRFKNTGSCAWTTSYQMVFASGSKMGGPDSVDFPVGVKVGETIDISVNLVAPTDAGDYSGYWRFKAANGTLFGSGPDSLPFWIKIKVGTTTMSGTSFVDAMCNAVWKSNNTSSLPCPAPNVNYSNGSVFRVDNPKLEGGYQDNEPALVMIPNNGSNGSITGTFPAYKVQSGDHFISLVGCMDNSPSCSVTIKLSYTVDGTNITDLGTWDQTSDGKFQKVDFDLSSLADQSVKFIFYVSNKDGSSTDDQAFWLNPQIKQ